MKDLTSVLSSKRFDNLTVKTISQLDYICKCKAHTTDGRECQTVFIGTETPLYCAADFLYAIEHFIDSLNEFDYNEFNCDKLYMNNVSVFEFNMAIDTAKAKDFYKGLKAAIRKDNKIEAASKLYGKYYNIYNNETSNEILDIDDIFFYYQCEIAVLFCLDLNINDFTCESFAAYIDVIYTIYKTAEKYKL